jgi:cytochrome c-type biogenesis protein CcmH
MSSQDRSEMIRGMVERLAERLGENPADLPGWMRLARARAVLGDKQGEKFALGKIAELKPKDVDAQLSYANAIISLNGSKSLPSSELRPILDRILARDELQPRALWIAGLLAASDGDPKTARIHWSKLLTVTDPNSIKYIELKNRINKLNL